MAEYIEKGVALATMSKHGITRNMRANKAVAALPAADVAPVVHGRWIEEVYTDLEGECWIKYRCNLCARINSFRQPYCNCGAKMDGGENDA